jgi:hypothetical protein
LKKRSKKLLQIWQRVRATLRPTDKSFLVLFFKKELPSLACSAAAQKYFIPHGMKCGEQTSLPWRLSAGL